MKSKNNIRNISPKEVPLDGWAGLKQNYRYDSVSGFVVFLLALPLSLGIAKASDFPPLMGLLSAIIGGIVVSVFMGARLTIKGPAAGLIVIVASAVSEFGGGDSTLGWHLTLGAMVVAGLVQIMFGVLKLGKLADFFPLSAIHGMLAAIGIIIIVKQIPVLLDINPAETKGLGIFELIGEIPHFIKNLDAKATFIGVVSLAIMLGWKYITNPFVKRIPAPLVVLLFAVPTELLMDFRHTEPPYALVKIGSFVDSIHVNVSFAGISHVGAFIKYVVMFALVGSLESLLTLKAVDMMDPYKRKSNANQDLIAVGIGNTLAAVLGGLPMISEVARSTANVNNGARTRWSDFFHGLYLLIFVIFAASLIELIPNAALAAMLITVGIKLAHPLEFKHMFKIGKEQLLIFMVTIFFTLYEDLLVGIAAGILVKVIIHIINGTKPSDLFKAPIEISQFGDNYLVEIKRSVVFSNFIGIKGKLDEIPCGKDIKIDLAGTKLVDHSAMESFEHFKQTYQSTGGKVEIIGLENHKAFSHHPLAGRRKKTRIR